MLVGGVVVAAGVGTGIACSTLLVVWFRSTPPFSWVWPHVERFGAATGITDALLRAERALHAAWEFLRRKAVPWRR